MNYNIMNIIMDKMTFKEWEERMIKINEEYKDLYKSDEQDYHLDMRVCANKKCMCNDYYFRKYNYYRFDINIYKFINIIVI